MSRPLTRRVIPLTLLLLILGIALGLVLAQKVKASPTNLVPISSPLVGACHPIPITWYSPTGVAGCTVYGTGTASHWGGPGVARNDCLWPWEACTPIRITSLDTGRSITLTPRMFCDCFTRTSDQRIVDLDPSALSALGLDPSLGLYKVSVYPVTALPDTALASPSE